MNSFNLPDLERNILDFWKQENIFAQVVAARLEGKPFEFYDGPPFATGLPHYGHIMQMANKDAVIRYKTMQGYHVPRKIGWDTHGLPVEYQLEKELEISGKRDIERFGIENFVEAARGIVLRYTKEWQSTMERIGRWVDLTNPYATMDNEYIESVWWAFKRLYDKDLIYRDFRVSPYCPRCGTVLANFEVNQGYQDDVPDISVYVALPIKDGRFAGMELIFWTTTPWTIPAVAAMSVNSDLDYVVVEAQGKNYILAKDRVADLFNDASIKETLKGSDLVGATYEPLYTIGKGENLHRVVVGEHVTTEDGTGIASIAPAYGEVDSEVGRREKLPMIQIVEPDGTIKTGLELPGEGQFVKKADKAIIADLNERGSLILEKPIKHTYPFCWRCSTPLLYYPASSWFVKVTAFKDRLVEENKKIKWQPENLRDGRFGKWLEGARDWAISRDRYWGAPLPIWECKECHALKVVQSRNDLNLDESFDLHRPYIDAITIPCDTCQSTMRRVPFVFDCWFESGSMPYAQHHYPFEHQDHFNPAEHIGYPADFIAEALDQTRGWFYTMHVLGVGLFDQLAYRNAVVSGLILAPDGKKLSKSLRNYTAPEVLFEEQGVDAFRLFLFTATGLGEDYRFSDAGVQDVKRRWIVPLLNVLNYYELSQIERDTALSPEPQHAMLDEWIQSRVFEARKQIIEAMDGSEAVSPFDLVRASRTFGPLVEDLSTWYVRLSRGRKDPAFTATLQKVLIEMATTFAPFLPFVTEHIYQSIRSGQDQLSVHMRDLLLNSISSWENSTVLLEMQTIREIVSAGRELRAKHGLPLRQPLARLEFVSGEVSKGKALSDTAVALIAQELQIEEVARVARLSESLTLSISGQIALDTKLSPQLESKGRANELRRLIQDLRKQAGMQPGDRAKAWVESLPEGVYNLLIEQLPHTDLMTEEPQEAELVQTTYSVEGKEAAVRLYKA